MEEFENAWRHLKFSAEEEEVIMAKDESQILSEANLPLCLAGKLLTSKKFNATAMKSTLAAAWNLENEVAVRELGPNVFIFQFFSIDDKIFALEKGPWCFDDHLLLFAGVQADSRASTFQFTHSEFWIHAIDIPFGLRAESTLRAIGNKFGGYLTHDADDPLLLGDSLRIRIKFDVSKPLLRRVAIKSGDKTFWVGVKYERLPVFCYCCGRLNHQMKDCTDAEAKENSKFHPQFGVWLHAPKAKRRLRPSKAEYEREKTWIHNLRDKSFTAATPKVGGNDEKNVGQKKVGTGPINEGDPFFGTFEGDATDVVNMQIKVEGSTRIKLKKAHNLKSNNPLSPHKPKNVDKPKSTNIPSKPNKKEQPKTTLESGLLTDDEACDMEMLPNQSATPYQNTGTKRKSDSAPLSQEPFVERGNEKKQKGHSGAVQVAFSVTNMAEDHVRERQ